MYAFILAALVIGTPSPQPQATPQLKVIVNVRSTSLCTAVKDTVVPVAYVTKRNEEAFAAIDHSMVKFFENTRGVSALTLGQMQSMDNQLDNALLYSPEGEIDVMRMDKIAYEITQNLTLEDQVMDSSWKQYPKGVYENIDALRQRMQNMLDLQRALANKYLTFTQMYRDNEDQAKSAQSAASFVALLHSTILGLGGALADERTQDDPEILPQASASNVARYGNVADVVKELRFQEVAFAHEIATAGHTCGY